MFDRIMSLVLTAAAVIRACAGCSRPPIALDPAPDSLAPRNHDWTVIPHPAGAASCAPDRGVAVLAEYSKRQEFPHNLTKPTTTHIFRDSDGRRCTVANSCREDGAVKTAGTT